MSGDGGWEDNGGGMSARVARALPVVFALVLTATLAALLYFVGQAGNERDEALAWQRRSFGVINLVVTLDSTIAKAESTLARYVISLDPDEGRVYQSQASLAGSQIAALIQEVSDRPRQAALADKLRDVYAERRRVLDDIALRTTYDQKMGALARFHRSGQAESRKQLNDLIREITRAEQATLAERNARVSRSEDRSQVLSSTSRLFALILLIGLIGLGWAGLVVLADRRRTRQAAEAEMLRADELEAAVAERTEELEIANASLREEAAERQAAEEHLRQLHKMEAVGQLTGGIAHDFNNMLAVVVGGLELAKRRLHEDPHHAERHLDNALLGADRAAALTRRLLAFARSEPLLPVAIGADTLVKGMRDLIDRTIGDQIAVRFELDAGDWAVWVDKHQLENAILNLAVNARDAMEGRGRLTVATGHATLAANEVGECPAGDYVLISVTDSGCGMAPEVLERVFEPFFTTKPVGQGTGLGLSQIFGFVRRCRGEIRISSEPGMGTEVRLYLPRHMGEARARPSEPVIAPVDRPEGVRVLVVEDDPRVLAQTMAAVRELGHVAVACDHPRKAAALLGEDGADIGLILSDVLMPDMTGPEMVRALAPALRAIPVLFVTGFAGDVDDAMFEGRPVLRKPYTLAALSAAMAETLSEQHPIERAEAAE